MARNSAEQGWWQVRSGVERIRFFCTQQQESTQLFFQHRKMSYYAGFEGGGVFAYH